MRHLLSTLILCIAGCTALSCCGFADSSAAVSNERCDTVVISYIPNHGHFTTEDREDFPPQYATVEYGEIIDFDYFDTLMAVSESSYKLINDVIIVDFYTCDWDMVNRFERLVNNPNPTLKEVESVTRNIFYPLTSLKKRDEEYFINIQNEELKHVLKYAHSPKVLVMADTTPMLLPKCFDGELFKITGKITYKYSSNYLKYCWDHSWELFDYTGVGPYFQFKDGRIIKVPHNSTIMHILEE